MVDLNNTVFLRLRQADFANREAQRQQEQAALGDALKFVTNEREGQRQYDLGREDLHTRMAEDQRQFNQLAGERGDERAYNRSETQRKTAEAEQSEQEKIAALYEEARGYRETEPDQDLRDSTQFLEQPVVASPGPERGMAVGRGQGALDRLREALKYRYSMGLAKQRGLNNFFRPAPKDPQEVTNIIKLAADTLRQQYTQFGMNMMPPDAQAYLDNLIKVGASYQALDKAGDPRSGIALDKINQLTGAIMAGKVGPKRGGQQEDEDLSTAFQRPR